MSKYPRTYHLPFSPEIHSDDKTINQQYLTNFINQPIVITEKADGGNTCLKNGKVYARTHNQETTHPSFSVIKSLYAGIYPLMEDKDLEIFGENLYAIHSLEYTNLKSFFYAFGIRKDNIWLSFENTQRIAESLGFVFAPVLFEGTFSNIKDIQKFMEQEIKKPSSLGGEREGFVIRIQDSFHQDDFSKYVAKYVRTGHVQTDERWEKNWKKARLN